MFATTGVDEKILSENAQEEVIEVMNGCMYVLIFVFCPVLFIVSLFVCLFVDQFFRPIAYMFDRKPSLLFLHSPPQLYCIFGTHSVFPEVAVPSVVI